jgi:hypothetical protein
MWSGTKVFLAWLSCPGENADLYPSLVAGTQAFSRLPGKPNSLQPTEEPDEAAV